MKVWLNDLKEGDKFYHILLDNVYQCEHLGDAHNMNFKMSRIKFEILDDETIFNEDLLGNVHEAFVNQYVYDNYENETTRCMFIVSLISADSLTDEHTCDETIEVANFILNHIDLFILEDNIKKDIISKMKSAIKIAKRDKKEFFIKFENNSLKFKQGML